MKAGVICLIPDHKVRDEATKQGICGICGAAPSKLSGSPHSGPGTQFSTLSGLGKGLSSGKTRWKQERLCERKGLFLWGEAASRQCRRLSRYSSSAWSSASRHLSVRHPWAGEDHHTASTMPCWP